MEYLHLLLLFSAGLIAGIINVMSGGGSMLTVPALIFLGLEPNTANGTNRIGIVFQSITSILSFRRQGFYEPKTGLFLSLFTIPGALLGTWLAVIINPEAFKFILALLMIVSTVSLFLPKKKKSEMDQASKPKQTWFLYVGMFLTGIYGGFIQIGVGFLFMIFLYRGLQISLVKVNMHKVLIILIFTIPSLAIFLYSGMVDLYYGLILAAGNGLGGWIAVKLTIRSGDRWIKWLTAFIIAVMAAKLLWTL